MCSTGNEAHRPCMRARRSRRPATASRARWTSTARRPGAGGCCSSRTCRSAGRSSTRCTPPGAPPCPLPHPTLTLLQTRSSSPTCAGASLPCTCTLPRPALPYHVGKLCSMQSETHTAYQRGVHGSASPLLGPALPLTQTCMCGDMHLHYFAQQRRARAGQACFKAGLHAVRFRCFPALIFAKFFVLQGAALPGTCCVRRAVAGHRCAFTPDQHVTHVQTFNLYALGSPSALGRRPSP
jgi:hypothetical protein